MYFVPALPLSVTALIGALSDAVRPLSAPSLIGRASMEAADTAKLTAVVDTAAICARFRNGVRRPMRLPRIPGEELRRNGHREIVAGFREELRDLAHLTAGLTRLIRGQDAHGPRQLACVGAGQGVGLEVEFRHQGPRER